MPGQSVMPGQPYSPQAQQPQTAVPGLPPMPQYQMPPSRSKPIDNLPPPPEAPSTPYDFFMQPKPTTPINPLPVGGRHLGNYPGKPDLRGRNRFIFLIAGAAGLIIILLLVVAFSPKDPTPGRFMSIAQMQQEIIRLCTQGTTRAKFRSTRYFAVTCSTGVTGSQKQLLAYMSSAKLEYDSKLLGATASSKSDSRLKSAESSSTYDDVFRDIVEADLTAYNRALTSQLGLTTGANGREVLTKNQRATELLIQLVKDKSDKTEAPAIEN
jgi:hypothetical protein